MQEVPEKDALVYGTQRLSYRELEAASRRAAEVFRREGVGRGDRVAVMTYNSPGFLIAAFGIWRAGGVLVPVNHKLTAPEVEYTIAHSGARVGVVSADLVSAARGERRRRDGSSPRRPRTATTSRMRTTSTPPSRRSPSGTASTEPRTISRRSSTPPGPRVRPRGACTRIARSRRCRR
ncbi:AMP-binding protein [Prescottella defluvii]|nr:AMP-binding protein [Prescottella defluvii]